MNRVARGALVHLPPQHRLMLLASGQTQDLMVIEHRSVCFELLPNQVVWWGMQR